MKIADQACYSLKKGENMDIKAEFALQLDTKLSFPENMNEAR